MTIHESDLRKNNRVIADFPACVYKVLESIRTSQPEPTSSALYALCSVQQIAAQLDFLSGDYVYQRALEYLLTELITAGLAHHRRVMGLPPGCGTESQQQALEDLERDTRSGNRELLSWGLLYYRYVRVDLDLTNTQLCQAVNVDARSLRRYRQSGIKRVADWLLQAELQIRFDDSGDSNASLTDFVTYHAFDHILDRDTLLEVFPTVFDMAPAHPRLAGWST